MKKDLEICVRNERNKKFQAMVKIDLQEILSGYANNIIEQFNEIKCSIRNESIFSLASSLALEIQTLKEFEPGEIISESRVETCVECCVNDYAKYATLLEFALQDQYSNIELLDRLIRVAHQLVIFLLSYNDGAYLTQNQIEFLRLSIERLDKNFILRIDSQLSSISQNIFMNGLNSFFTHNWYSLLIHTLDLQKYQRLISDIKKNFEIESKKLIEYKETFDDNIIETC
ncbi:MAG: hypothetical protein K6C97_04360 [Treponema sp.]|nr:hypothetical protein [Treponema sp.]